MDKGINSCRIFRLADVKSKKTDEKTECSINLEKYSEPSQQPFNLILFGETGVGKSSLVNLMANLLAFRSFEEASSNGKVKCLIPYSFTVVDEDYNEHRVNIGATAESSSSVGASVTQEARAYSLDAKVDDKPIRLNVIDTPGIGDTRGIEQDKKNFEKVIEYLNQFDGLNAICFVLKPDSSRLTAQFRYCLKELLVKLDRGTAPNICFCYTHARGTSFRPGEGYPLIKKELAEIAKESGTLIPVERSNTFCFDSEAFRYLAAKEKGIKFEDSFVEGFKKSWEHSADALNKMISHAANLSPASVRSIFMLNQARKTLMALSRPVAELSRVIQTNLKLAEDKERRLEKSTESLKESFLIDQVNLETEVLEKPRTVCTHTSCRQAIMFQGQPKINYNSECHPVCHLKDVTVDTIAHPSIKGCTAFNMGRTENCIKCGHHWKEHMHILSTFKEVTIKVEDPEVRAMIYQARSRHEILTEGRHHIQKRIEDLKAKQEWLIKSSAKIAKYIKHKGILYYNPNFEDYLELLISEEEQKNQLKGNNQAVLNGLKQAKRDFLTEVKILTDNLNAGVDVGEIASDEEMAKLFIELKGTKISGIDLGKYLP